MNTKTATDIVWHFSHIQKTAGTSLGAHLASFCSQEKIWPRRFEFELRDDPDVTSYRLFWGHVSPSALLEYFPEFRLITFLRDPTERLISAYYYWKENAEPNIQSNFFRKIREMSFLEFLTSDEPLIKNAVFNAQSRLLAGGRFGATNHTRTCIIGPYMEEVEIIRIAKQTIESAFFVGITEKFDLSVKLLFEKAGIPSPSGVFEAQRRHI